MAMKNAKCTISFDLTITLFTIYHENNNPDIQKCQTLINERAEGKVYYCTGFSNAVVKDKLNLN